MRFMMFMYPQISEEDWNPSAEAVAEMARYNEELRKAGMLLALDGLRPPVGRRLGRASRARRVGGHRRALHRGQGGRRRLLDDPGALDRGGGRVGEALPGEQLPDRGPPDLRDGGLPRRRARGDRARPGPPPGQTDGGDGPTPGRRSRRSGGSSPPASSPAWRGWSATSGWPRTWRRTRWWRRSRRWPRDGVPDNPGAWLMATAKNRAIDLARRAQTYERKREEVAHELGI